MRLTIVEVLPEPADAETRIRPRSSTAFFWSSVRRILPFSSRSISSLRSASLLSVVAVSLLIFILLRVEFKTLQAFHFGHFSFVYSFVGTYARKVAFLALILERRG